MSGQQPPPEISITPPEPAGFPLTQEFLEIAFEKEVENFEVTLGTNPGDNYLSIIHAVEVNFKGEKEPKYYLIKCYPNHPGRREFLDQVNVFEKELFMYDDFLKQLLQLAEERGASHVAMNVAPFHGGNVTTQPPKKFNMEPWSTENFIIMTDLRKSEGYRMADRIQGLDWDHAVLVLKEIARLHALTWAYKSKNGIGHLSSKYPNMIDQMYTNEELNKSFKGLMHQMAGNAITLVKEVLGEDHPASKNFQKFMELDVLELMKKFTPPEGINEDEVEGLFRVKPKEDKSYYKGNWLVGTHGDCWVNNQLFKYDPTSDPPKPVKTTLVDYQIFREACLTLDLTYFLTTSLRAPLRIPREKEILKVYHDTFISACEALKVEPLPGFTVENLTRKYNRAKLFGLLVSLPLLTIVLKPKEESVDMDKEKGEDIAELFSSVMKGSDKNVSLKVELAATVLKLYEEGVL